MPEISITFPQSTMQLLDLIVDKYSRDPIKARGEYTRQDLIRAIVERFVMAPDEEHEEVIKDLLWLVKIKQANRIKRRGIADKKEVFLYQRFSQSAKSYIKSGLKAGDLRKALNSYQEEADLYGKAQSKRMRAEIKKVIGAQEITDRYVGKYGDIDFWPMNILDQYNKEIGHNDGKGRTR